jgi:predicted RNase H-like nuclease (RuvC/YqgF family)
MDKETELLTNEELVEQNRKLHREIDNLEFQISEYRLIVEELSKKLESIDPEHK